MAASAEMPLNPSFCLCRDVRDVRLSRCRRGLGREVAAFVPPGQINGRGVRCEKSTWRRVSSPLSSRGLGLFSSCLTGMGWSHRVLTWPELYQERHRRFTSGLFVSLPAN